MVCTANDLSEWKDFPKGLKVLLLDEDSSSAAEIKSKLEAMDYTVAIFCNEKEALAAFSDKPESFHVAVVEVAVGMNFLESAKELPTIMTSSINCLSTMMKCIALGAMEFLHKPLSEDKLRNIWQHVVHKAFNAGQLETAKDSAVSTLQLKVEPEEAETVSPRTAKNDEQSPTSDKYPAPSTPQLNQGSRLLDDGDCQDHTNCSTDKETAEQDGESKFVETSFTIAEMSVDTENLTEAKVKEEDDLSTGAKNESVKNPCPQKIQDKPSGGAEERSKASSLNTSGVTKASRKKMKVDWTPDLHRKFVQAVEQLGVDQAIPSKILELMKVEGLTRHNVASHLQKYRMHKRHILPKADERRWPQHKDQTKRSYYPHKPIMAYPPPPPPPHQHPNHHAFPPNSVYPMWGSAAAGNHHHHPPGVQMWGPPTYSPWTTSPVSWQWKPYPPMNAEAWGCPVMPQPPVQMPYSCLPHNQSEFHDAGIADNHCTIPQNSFDLQPAEEVIDKVVKEAISKPWLPLPLGLNPPSTESVLDELCRQGIVSASLLL